MTKQTGMVYLDDLSNIHTKTVYFLVDPDNRLVYISKSNGGMSAEVKKMGYKRYACKMRVSGLKEVE